MNSFIHIISGLDVSVHEDATGGFYAVVPALPGCGSQGESVFETLENLDDAIMTVLDIIGEDDPDRLLRLCGSMTSPSRIEASDFSASESSFDFEKQMISP